MSRWHMRQLSHAGHASQNNPPKPNRFFYSYIVHGVHGHSEVVHKIAEIQIVYEKKLVFAQISCNMVFAYKLSAISNVKICLRAFPRFDATCYMHAATSYPWAETFSYWFFEHVCVKNLVIKAFSLRRIAQKT